MRKRKWEDGNSEEGSKKRKTNPVKAVMFCPYTWGGGLASKLREGEEQMEKLTGYRLKIVEQTGDKLLDLLQFSNPWRGKDCGRTDCWLCQTKAMTEKNLKQDCTRRSLMYETWCETCYREGVKNIMEQEDPGPGREESLRKIV